MTEPFPLIDVFGAPRERGRQYGRQAEDRIRKGIAHYTAQLSGLAFDARGISRLVHDYLPAMEEFEESYIDEMRGIAEGAGLSFEEIVLLNARTEILKLATRPDLRAQLSNADDPDGCTTVVVLPQAARDRRLIHAQNWDWKRECVETTVVLRVRQDDGPDVLTLTEAGALARLGLNEAGIAITGNYLESDRDYTQIGVPLPLIRRKVLESEHLALAMRAVYSTPKSASSNMAVSHRDGIVINFECAPDETFQVHPKDDLLVHANHWISPVALAKLKDTGILNAPDSLYRDIRMRDLLAPQIGSITSGTVKTALLDDFATPWSVCRPPRLNMAGGQTATVATVVMQPALGVMDVAPLPALNPRFATYCLGDSQPASLAR